jgi:hypothetical protein
VQKHTFLDVVVQVPHLHHPIYADPTHKYQKKLITNWLQHEQNIKL